MTTPAYFTRTGETFTPLPIAASLWSADQMHGVAVSGLLAKGIESALEGLGREGMVPARYRIDLFRAARMLPTHIVTTVVREGPRLVLIDGEVRQGDTVVARGSATFLATGEQPAGVAWESTERSAPPPLDLVPVSDEMRTPYFESLKPWSTDFAEHTNGGRHATWQSPVPTVAGESMSPFVMVAAVADTTSMITNWSDAGIEWINADVSVAISRLPVSLEVGIRATDHVSSEGIAAGTAELFDRAGTFGTSTVTALANARRTVKFEEQPHHVADAGFGDDATQSSIA
ncbi:acyl-CoA thioesterase domain-containing protein [Nocardioides sp. Kera G14]|uniref:acyl-CoA thioesterase domain-containing protein n=1 Tax=Nocardioides sp. Kera G14 TaxID=2884264 RepID=UPI001D1222F1|nr:acyl-CoA thioesterase domain-containing protein [Nocardioides sp. Kera G14]UDY22196.1 thioesterase family protein [Nocardioides sp. Kera G14]